MYLFILILQFLPLSAASMIKQGDEWYSWTDRRYALRNGQKPTAQDLSAAINNHDTMTVHFLLSQGCRLDQPAVPLDPSVAIVLSAHKHPISDYLLVKCWLRRYPELALIYVNAGGSIPPPCFNYDKCLRGRSLLEFHLRDECQQIPGGAFITCPHRKIYAEKEVALIKNLIMLGVAVDPWTREHHLNPDYPTRYSAAIQEAVQEVDKEKQAKHAEIDESLKGVVSAGPLSLIHAYAQCHVTPPSMKKALTDLAQEQQQFVQQLDSTMHKAEEPAQQKQKGKCIIS